MAREGERDMNTPGIEYFTARDGVRLAYRRWGQAGGARVVAIHPLALDSSLWADVAAELGPGVDLVALDCRGHGRSDPAPGPYTVEGFGDDVADLLVHLGWRDAVAAGCSMGGCVALAFAARHPDRLAGLVLVDTTAWYGEEAPRTWKERGETARRDGFASMAGFQTTRWFSDSFRETRQDRVEAVVDIFNANDIECYASTCALMGAVDLRAALASVAAPTVVIVGEEDYATPVEAARVLHEGISGARLKILPRARHLTLVECPDAIAAEIAALRPGRA